ncbi:MAG: N-acyl homoserine lactonase family protein [Mycobacteriales bacterium]
MTSPAESGYSIWVAEYARVLEFPVSGALYGRHNSGTMILPFCYALLKSDKHTVMVDVGYNYAEFGQVLADAFGVSGWQPPEVVLGRIGVDPADVDTVVLTHNHFDHAGNVDAFPNAQVYIQEMEVRKFLWTKSLPKRLQWLMVACDPDDLLTLLDCWKEGRLTLLDGDAQVLPGIRVVSSHDTHTLGSQYVVIDQPTSDCFVLSGDNVTTYENLEGQDGNGEFIPIGLASGSITKCLLTMEEMFQLVRGDIPKILPFHENKLWDRYPSRQFDDGLHLAEIFLRDGERSRLT